MPLFFQHPISNNTRLGIWKIEETEDFFKGNVPNHRDVTHPHKRLQHLAGRFLLQFLFPDFPYELIQIADTRKPFLSDEQYHFSISHCGDYAAAIVSKDSRVGIDIEVPAEKIEKIKPKFLSEREMDLFSLVKLSSNFEQSNSGAQIATPDSRVPTLLWSAKEAVFKWYGDGGVDFKKHIQLQNMNDDCLVAFFGKTDQQLMVEYRQFDQLVLAWVQN